MEVLYCNVCFLTTIVMFVLFAKGMINIIDNYTEFTEMRKMNLASFARINQ